MKRSYQEQCVLDEIHRQDGTRNGATVYYLKEKDCWCSDLDACACDLRPNRITLSAAFCTMFVEDTVSFSDDIIPFKDIELVMKQANVKFEQARRALVDEKGDIVNAIACLEKN